MSWRGTLLLLILAVLSVGYLFFSDRSRTHPPQEPLLGINPAEASEIRIQEGSSLISLNQTNGLWMIRNNQIGQTDRANPQLINSLLETAADIVPLDILRSQDLKGHVSLSSLGLKKPNRSIAIRAGKTETLWIGMEGAAPQSLYARLDSGKTVYLISSKIASVAFRPAQEFRDPRLTMLSSDHLDEVSLTKGDTLQQLQLKRDQKGTRGWLLAAPISTRGDDQAVTNWLDNLLGLQILRWMPEGTDAASCGLDTPTARITLHEEGATSPLILSFGAATSDATGIFVKCSDRPGIAIVGNSVARTLAITPQALRSKKISPVEYDTIDRMEIDDYYLHRKAGGDDWIGHDEGEPDNEVISGEQVRQWYDQLQGLSAVGFEAATPEHLAERGLAATNHPLTIRLIAILSENTAQEDKGETVLAEYSFGTGTNNEVALREGDSPELLILPESSVEFLKTFPGVEHVPAINSLSPGATNAPASQPATP